LNSGTGRRELVRARCQRRRAASSVALTGRFGSRAATGRPSRRGRRRPHLFSRAASQAATEHEPPHVHTGGAGGGRGLGWVAHQARVQRNAAAAITRAGGIVTYDRQCSDGSSRPNRNATPPSLRRTLGPGYFEEARQVAFRKKSGDDAVMLEVGQLRGLRSTSCDFLARFDAGHRPDDLLN
jgi:hypothetical protein